MPLYEYRCEQCGAQIEKLQSHRAMKEDTGNLRCSRCEGRMFYFPSVPAIVTETTFTRTMGDGIKDDFKRRFVYEEARKAGVNPNGKIYCPGLCRPGMPGDPRAWVDASDARGQIRKRCEELNYAAEGDINVKQREPERDPFEGGYKVADSLVQEEVDKIVAQEHGGKVSRKKRAQLVEATSERFSGNQ